MTEAAALLARFREDDVDHRQGEGDCEHRVGEGFEAIRPASGAVTLVIVAPGGRVGVATDLVARQHFDARCRS